MNSLLNLIKTIFIIVVFLSSSIALAIIPPKDGKFPPGFLQSIKKKQIDKNYRNSAWAIKMDLQKSIMKNNANHTITNNFTMPILLSAFSDLAGTYTVSDFQNLLWDNNPSGSLTDYYNEISYGSFEVTGTTYGWYTADNNMEYYVANNNGEGDFPNNVEGFIVNILNKADAGIDFSLYDNDGPDGIPNSGDDDGFVDALGIVFTGFGGNYGGVTDRIWPHKSSISEYETNDQSVNGGLIKILDYMICNETDSNQNLEKIGVFAHEFGHV